MYSSACVSSAGRLDPNADRTAATCASVACCASAVGGGRRLVGSGAGRLVLHGQQERLPVFGLYVVDELRDLFAVAHQLRDPVGVADLLDLAVRRRCRAARRRPRWAR